MNFILIIISHPMWKHSAWMKAHGLDTGLLLVRVAAGVIFTIHGYQKLFGSMGMTAFTGMLQGMGFPLPGMFAYLAALSEFFGGLALILGVFTCTAGALLTIVMLVAITMVKHWSLPKGDVDLALLGIALLMMLGGPGKYSVAKMSGMNKE